MYLQNLRINNFRNYEDQLIEFDPELNLICGNNAQGKSNLLEAIAYLSLTSSFRGVKDNELLCWNKDYFFVCGELIKKIEKLDLRVGYQRQGRKIWQINKEAKNRLADIVGIFHTVIFSPEDLLLVKEGPQLRRKFLNRQMSQLYDGFCQTLIKYNKILKQKNTLLKESRARIINDEEIEPWNEQLSELGAIIIKKRLDVLTELKIFAAEKHRILAQEEQLDLCYESFLPESQMQQMTVEEIKDALFMVLKNKIIIEKKAAVSVLGPHRDDLSIFINQKSARNFASQGQQKSCAIALKLAELALAEQKKGEKPVLLLDDVMSELDSGRQECLLSLLKRDIQTFITDTKQRSDLSGHLFIVKGGKVLKA